MRNCNPDCVLVVLQFLYSGELHLRDCDPGKVLNVARACKIAPLEIMLASYGATPTVGLKQEVKNEFNANSDSWKNHEAPRVELANQDKRKARQDESVMKPPPEFFRKFCQVINLTFSVVNLTCTVVVTLTLRINQTGCTWCIF